MAKLRFNQVTVAGTLTADPGLRRIQSSNKAVADLRFVIDNSYKDAAGQWKEDPCYVDVTVFDYGAEKLVEKAGAKKGDNVFVVGRLKMESWDDKSSGQKRTKIKIVADRVDLIPREEKGQGGNQRSSQAESDEPRGGGSYAPAGSGGDDEIPF